MNIKSRIKKILPPGIHLVIVKGISVVRNDQNVPVSWTDPASGEPVGAYRILLMGKNQFGIEWDLCLFQQNQKRIEAFKEALALKNELLNKDILMNRKLYIAVNAVYYFENGQPKMGDDGKQLVVSKLRTTEFWKDGKRPVVEGDPETNGGVCGGDFLWHYDGGKYFQPIQHEPVITNEQYLALQNLPVEKPEEVVLEVRANKEFDSQILELSKDNFAHVKFGEETESVFPQETIDMMRKAEIAKIRPVGAHEFRMKSRCERCEAIGMVWDGQVYRTDSLGFAGAAISHGELLNQSDENFNKWMGELEQEFAEQKDLGMKSESQMVDPSKITPPENPVEEKPIRFGE